MSVRKRFLGGMLSGAGSVLFKTGLNIIVVPLFISHLGLDAFGLYLLLIAIFEISSLMDLGTTNALVTLVGQESPDSEDRRAFLKVGHVLYTGLALLLVTLGLIVWPFFVPQFHIGPELQFQAQAGLLMILFEAALMLYSCYFHAILLSHCAHQWTNIADTLYNIIANVGALCLLLAGYGVTAVLAARLLGAVFRLGLMMLQARKLEPFTFRPKMPFQLESFKKVTKLSSHAMMLNFSVIISHKIDDIVIARFLPLSAVSIYEIVFRLLGVTVQVCIKLAEGSFPLYARMSAARQIADARQLFLRMSSLLYLVASLLILAIVCHYTELFSMFSAHRIPLAQTWPVLVLAVPCLLSGVLQMPASGFLFASGHQKFLTITSLMAALSNLVLSLLLVKPFGIAGVALGTLIPQLIQHQAGLIRKACLELGISAKAYLWHVHAAILIPLAVSFLWIQLLKPLVQTTPHPLLPIAAISASAGLLGIIIWFALTASPLERDLLHNKVIQPLRSRFKQNFMAG
jgi:O-antigen/teichoic acid export membrane protein